ncbi:MFS transporter [Pectobacterium atrosepticum]|uniref:MFS transporter n=2 Tax=Pectobacterium atrosepticum TaxID=29471 RepID=UPI00049ABEC1|nr:MFS transporter [Pectobacterium atrosepticum]GKV85208.1 MFS transporter [Pectobacterium carotovorum subsp. carotovorum]AIA71261.1 Fosmidomycin resistance protein [Pectobacterium atrosepticum]AIK13914.1 putative fosmidomycin exporter [Pectobacterium atrosepticum]KFX13963.1 Fosmidomycin resistance protein [Pectobacterium atrosepticum]KMK79098.1 fosmidomycin resistance protein [Pectobacterium atrosepticum ICMP 1526]
MLKENFTLSYAQIGMIALVYQITASLLQPWVGLYTDKRPKPYLLPAGMVVTFLGIGLLAIADSFTLLLISAALVGVGSSTFHPEASRVARMASGGKFGTAQSVFQVGGNAGTAFGPLIAALLILPHGQMSVAWLMIIALIAIVILTRISRWTIAHGHAQSKKHDSLSGEKLPRDKVILAVAIVSILMLTKFTYIASISNYYTFYLIQRFDITLRDAQFCLFAFLAAVAIGTFAGGPVGDRIGRKAVIWISFLGVIPFAPILPHANFFWTVTLTLIIGFVLSSAFAALVVYAQEVVPGRTGVVAGIMFGTMFGVGGIAAAGLGKLADIYGIVSVYDACGYLPLLGLATLLMPDSRKKSKSLPLNNLS